MGPQDLQEGQEWKMCRTKIKDLLGLQGNLDNMVSL